LLDLAKEKRGESSSLNSFIGITFVQFFLSSSSDDKFPLYSLFETGLFFLSLFPRVEDQAFVWAIMVAAAMG
jgi:hypothetical protein